MAQFDLYLNENPQTEQAFPYLLDIQNDILSNLPTRIVVPLSPKGKLSWDLENLTPVFIVECEEYFMNTADMASIYFKDLGDKVDSLANQRDVILGAVDFLFCGI